MQQTGNGNRIHAGGFNHLANVINCPRAAMSNNGNGDLVRDSFRQFQFVPVSSSVMINGSCENLTCTQFLGFPSAFNGIFAGIFATLVGMRQTDAIRLSDALNRDQNG